MQTGKPEEFNATCTADHSKGWHLCSVLPPLLPQHGAVPPHPQPRGGPHPGPSDGLPAAHALHPPVQRQLPALHGDAGHGAGHALRSAGQGQVAVAQAHQVQEVQEPQQ